MDSKLILDKMNSLNRGTLMETLNIRYTEVGKDFVVATMPVNKTVHQPMGLLHGGATAALAESVGSAASHFLIEPGAGEVRGIEISANHLRSVRDGMVTATGRLIHQGRRILFWEIKVVDEKDRLISVCKLTCMIVNKN